MNKFVLYSVISHLVVLMSFVLIKPSKTEIVNFSSPEVMELEFIDFQEAVQEVLEAEEEAPLDEEQKIEKPVEQHKEKVLAEKKVAEKIERKVEKDVEKPKIDSVKTKVAKEKQKPIESGAKATQASFVYDYYLKMLQDKVYRNFKPPYNLKLEDKIVTIYFDIDERGRVSNIEFKKKSQSGLLNRLAQRAIQDLKMPPLPKKFIDGGDKTLSINFTFVYDSKR